MPKCGQFCYSTMFWWYSPFRVVYLISRNILVMSAILVRSFLTKYINNILGIYWNRKLQAVKYKSGFGRFASISGIFRTFIHSHYWTELKCRQNRCFELIRFIQRWFIAKISATWILSSTLTQYHLYWQPNWDLHRSLSRISEYKNVKMNTKLLSITFG